MFPRLVISNREKIIVAVLALILWVSWLARYEVSPPTARNMIVMLDRWTGTVYVSFSGDQWKEIMDAQARHVGAPQPLSDAQVGLSPVTPSEKDKWETAPTKPSGKNEWEVVSEQPVIRSGDEGGHKGGRSAR